MPPLLRVLGVCVLLGMLLPGCSTPGQRAHQRSEAFARLSPTDQKLVLSGHVRPGLSQAGVYIAWGEPDRKTATGGAGKDDAGTETWVYLQRVTLYEPISSYEYFGPYHGYEPVPRAWLRPAFGLGGIGNEGLLQYQPHVRNLDTLRIAVFSGGKVDRYKNADGTWSQSAPTQAIKPAEKRAMPHGKVKALRKAKAKGSVGHQKTHGKKSAAHGKKTHRSHKGRGSRR